MRQFSKSLFRNVLTSGKASGGKPSTRRVRLQLEGLEDRKVLSNAFQEGSTLFVNVREGSTPALTQSLEFFELNPTGNRQIEVIDGTTDIGQFFINSLNTVVVTANGN